MHPAALLALLMIAMLILAGIRLELNFRRTLKAGATPEPKGAQPEPGGSPPELRIAPAGGYCQRPFPGPGFGKAGQARRAGFAL